MAPELKFLLIKVQIDLKINFLAIKSSINSNKNPIKSINIQIWAFLLKIQNFLLNRAFILQEYTVKKFNPCILNSLTNFLTVFWALLPPVIFLTSFGYLFYFFNGDPKMGYNRCPLFIILTEHGFCAVSFIKINQTELPKLIWSKLDRSETFSLQQSFGIPSGDSF